MDKSKLNLIKNVSFIGFVLVAIGNIYNFGDFTLSILFYPIEKQYFPVQFKNKFYMSCKKRKPGLKELSEPLIKSNLHRSRTDYNITIDNHI